MTSATLQESRTSVDAGANGIHRAIEHIAAVRGDAPALVHGSHVLTYRELNRQANGVARRLIAQQLRRGSRAMVCLAPGPDLAIALLGVLKAGGCYTWVDPRDNEGGWPEGISVAQTGTATEVTYRAVDVFVSADGSLQAGPNLPIVSRGSDIACVLDQGQAPTILVPHGTIASLAPPSLSATSGVWSNDPGALGLWPVLMAGETLTFGGVESRLEAA